MAAASGPATERPPAGTLARCRAPAPPKAVDDGHRALLATLIAHHVRFVLVGGVALQLHGFSAATRDVDITIAGGEANTRRLSAALVALHARPYLTGERGSAYRTDLGQLEVMHLDARVGDYDAWAQHASTIMLKPHLTVQVGSASDLLLAKEQAAGAKDTDALPQIRAELLASGALSADDSRGPVAQPAVDVAPDPAAAQLLGANQWSGSRRAAGSRAVPGSPVKSASHRGVVGGGALGPRQRWSGLRARRQHLRCAGQDQPAAPSTSARSPSVPAVTRSELAAGATL